ncbi:MAG: thioredoxin family protein [Blastopirellula sp.]|nr:MAG: thioredoxin family protein [Blastopirellula sp.]
MNYWQFITLSLLFSLIFFFYSSGVAGEFNPEIEIGDKAPVWENLPGVDGKTHSLADLKDKQLIVLAFTCNSCPYSVDYEDRLIALAKKYSGKESKVAVVAINCNKVPEDSLEAMQDRATEKKFNFPYLYDESQDTGRKIGAIRTPEFFVLDQKRTVIYMGAMDDSTDASKVKTNYIQLAINAGLKGELPKTTETIAIGCNIRYKRVRR